MLAMPTLPSCGGCSSNIVHIFVSSKAGDVGVGSLSDRYANGAYFYEPCNSDVSIFAEPNSGYQFVSWAISGDGAVGSPFAGATTLEIAGSSGGTIDLTLNVKENCNLPSGSSIQGNTPTGVMCYTPSISYYQNNQITVDMTQYYFFGPQTGSYNLNQGVSYNGPVVALFVLTMGELNAGGSWCEDSSGLYGSDTNGPTMQVDSYFTNLGVSGITDENPHQPWSFGSSGTVNAGLSLDGITLGYTYNVPEVVGTVVIPSGDGVSTDNTHYEWQQGLNMGGCQQQPINWSYGEVIQAAANSGTPWPKNSFDLYTQTAGNFWLNWSPCYDSGSTPQWCQLGLSAVSLDFAGSG